MKKLMLFVVTLVTCFISFAQQKELYDLKKMLEKKKQSGIPFSLQQYLNTESGTGSSLVSSHSVASKDHQAKLLSVLPNGNKIYSLPQDNMVCIVPVMKQFNMPVLKPASDGIMPNGSRNYKLIPQ